MNAKLLIGLGLTAIFIVVKGQQISMNFPKFAGKSYDFIIFQGNRTETVY